MLNKSFYICIKLYLTDDFAVLQFVKENNGKNCGFCVKKKDESLGSKILSLSNMDTNMDMDNLIKKRKLV